VSAQETVKLIIDTDPGVDDAMAYFYAHASTRIQTIALTTVFGNVTIEDANNNALWLTEFSQAANRVYAGAGVPRAMPLNPPAVHVHGERGLGNYNTGGVSGACEVESATDFLVDAVNQHPGELTLCAVGPLTNVAQAIDRDPGFVEKLRQLVIMGGSLRAGGNVTAHAEANFWHDPHAADAVLNAPGGGNITVVGLDVTHEINVGPDCFQTLAETAGQTGAFLHEIGNFYLDFYERSAGKRMCSLHDPAAIIACVHPEWFGTEPHRLTVTTSGDQIGKMLIADSTGAGRLCSVCTKVDADSVIRDFERIVALNT